MFSKKISPFLYGEVLKENVQSEWTNFDSKQEDRRETQFALPQTLRLLSFYIKSGSGAISGKAAYLKDDKEDSEMVTLDIKGNVDLHGDKDEDEKPIYFQMFVQGTEKKIFFFEGAISDRLSVIKGKWNNNASTKPFDGTFEI